jgi:hypothetical protein
MMDPKLSFIKHDEHGSAIWFIHQPVGAVGKTLIDQWHWVPVGRLLMASDYYFPYLPPLEMMMMIPFSFSYSCCQLMAARIVECISHLAIKLLFKDSFHHLSCCTFNPKPNSRTPHFEAMLVRLTEGGSTRRGEGGVSGRKIPFCWIDIDFPPPLFRPILFAFATRTKAARSRRPAHAARAPAVRTLEPAYRAR